MEKIPVSLFIDDGAPRIHIYRYHVRDGVTPSGLVLKENIPNSFLDAFCDVVEKHGIRGKLSIVPMAACRGDIINGFPPFPDNETHAWIETVNRRLSGAFSFSPEMLTHLDTYDIKNGGFLPVWEKQWAASQTRETLRPYVTKAISMLRDAGIRAVGSSSPWFFGAEVEDDYTAAISDAVYDVWGVKTAWVFVNARFGEKNVRPWTVFNDGDRRTITVPATSGDTLWDTWEVPEKDITPALISSIADRILTEDGESGDFAVNIKNNSSPVMLHHWQSMYSNGSLLGLRALELAVSRINRIYGDRIEWMSAEEQAYRAAEMGL